MAKTMQFWIDRTETPIGVLVLVVDHEGALRAVDWTDHEIGRASCRERVCR